MEGLRDKVVIVTGASSGIGEGIAYHFASCGSKLSLVARNKEKLSKVVENCIDKGLQKERIVYTIGDLTEDAVRKSLIESTVAAFGAISVLINNAGIANLGPIYEVVEEDYRRILEVNQTTPYLLTQLAVPYLKKSKGTTIGDPRLMVDITNRNMLLKSIPKEQVNHADWKNRYDKLRLRENPWYTTEHGTNSVHVRVH